MSWTVDKVEKLKELWSKGHTASQISNMLGDTTRNAVIGKAHRLDLEARAPSKRQQSSSKQEDGQESTLLSLRQLKIPTKYSYSKYYTSPEFPSTV